MGFLSRIDSAYIAFAYTLLLYGVIVAFCETFEVKQEKYAALGQRFLEQPRIYAFVTALGFSGVTILIASLITFVQGL